jgi:DNA-binding GntR family transcriptional regulator
MTNPNRVERLRQHLLPNRTAEAVREAILSGRFAQGERLHEQRLSEELGISRGPLREAFRQLEREGLVESLPHRGTFVTRFTAKDVADVLLLREIIEPFAISRAIEHAGPNLVGQLQEALVDMYRSATAGDPAGVAEAHTRLHRAFYVNADHRMLAAVWERLESPLRLYLLMHQVSFTELGDVPREHERIVQLAATADLHGLQIEIAKHLRVNITAVLTLATDTGQGGHE